MATSSANKGFTVLELLVVIAIIGILSGIVMAGLNSSRKKGVDASIRTTLVSARSQAALYYETTGGGTSYNNVCGNGTSAIGPLVLAAAKNLSSSVTVGGWNDNFVYSASGGGTNSAAICHDTAAGWAAIVSLKNSTTNSGWCVDSTGASKEVTALVAHDLTC